MVYNSNYSGQKVDELLDKSDKDNVGTVDSKITEKSQNPVTSEAIFKALKEADSKLTELESELTPLGVSLGTIETEIFLNNQYINTEGTCVSATGLAITNVVTLNKGESISAFVALYEDMAVFTKTQNAAGYGTLTPLLLGKGISEAQWHRYTATEDNTYVIVGYQKEKGIKVVKSSSSALVTIFDTLQTHDDDIKREAEINVNQGERINVAEYSISTLQLNSVDGIVNKVAAETGVTYKNEIKIKLSKKDIILAKVVVPTDVFKGSTIAVSAEDGTLVGYLPFNEWGELTIPIDTNSIYLGVYQTNVVGSGNIVFQLYKPYDTNVLLDNYPLKRGSLSETGDFSPSSKRQTTGLIRNIRPMKLRVENEDTSVGIVYGDSVSSLVFGGYIINKGGERETLIDINAKYIIINFVRSADYADDEWERFILAPQNSQIWEANTRIDKCINDAFYAADKSILMYQGLTNPVSGTIDANSTRITTGLIPYNGKPLQITINKGYSMTCLYGKNKPYTDLSYIISDGGNYILNVDAEVIALNVTRAGSNKPLTPNDDVGLFISEAKSAIANMVNKVKTPLDKLVEREIMNQFTKATTISDVNDVIAVSDGFDINNKGVLCAGCIGSDDSPEEHGNPKYTASLLLGNLADIEGTKKIIKVCEPYEWIDGIGIVESVANAKAKWLNDDEIALTFSGVFRQSDGIKQIYGNAAVIYNVVTETFGNFVYSTIKVGDITYPMYSIKSPNAETGVYEFEAESIANIEAIWQATDIEHPVGYSGVNSYTYYLGQNPKNIDGTFYAAMCLGNQSHTLCKSVDTVDWEFVCDIPLGQATEETAICYYNNRIYATSRGNYDVDKQYSKVMYCPFDSLTKESWSEPITLGKCMGERPTIVGLNNKVYIMQGHGNVSVYTEGVKIARAEKELFVLDLELNILKSHVMQFTFPMLHPQFLSFGGNLWSVLSTDKRSYAFTASGDSRSEIGVTHIDEYLFDL